MDRVSVGLLGVGTVGSGVVKLLVEQSDRLARRAGRRIELKSALVRDPSKRRGVAIDPRKIVTDPYRIINDPEISVVIEMMGGTEPTLQYVLDALSAGKDVVTANKALLAEHGPEGSGAGGSPIVQALGVSLAANQIQSLSAIVNGTCNFILTAMSSGGLGYDEALRQAQEHGYAEADPTIDVDGTDTAHKLAILTQIGFGVGVKTSEIPRTGIDTLQLADIRYAAELGYSVKLLATAKHSESGLALRVAPRLVKQGTPLAEVRGPYNAVRVVGDAVGDTLFYGRGAGMMPTASAVVGDLIDVLLGRAAITTRSLDLWPSDAPPPVLTPPSRIKSRHYMRFTIADKPGAIAKLAKILGDHAISIASVIQHDPGDDAPENSPVPLVVMTHLAVESGVADAFREIDRLGDVGAPSVCLGVEE